MKIYAFVLASLILSSVCPVQSAQTNKLPEQSPETRSLDILFSIVEKNVVSAADAMPANKYSFVPTTGEFKEVRTFAQQVKHLAATNHILAAAALGEDPPADAGDEAGPASMYTKADILTYVKESFVHLHQAIEKLNDKNTMIRTSPISPLREKDATKVGLIVEALIHSYDHYGQMVIYLRMNDVIPPASRNQ